MADGELAQSVNGLPPPAIVADLVEMITGVIDWDVDLSEPITGKTRLIADLDFQSIDVVMLGGEIEAHYRVSDLPWNELVVEDGDFVDEILVGDLAAFLDRNLGGDRG